MIVPKLLNFHQEQRRIDIAQEMLTMFNDYPDLLKKVIIDDESWVYDYDIEIKAQSSRSATIEKKKEKSKQKQLAIPKSVFQKCFEDWKKGWHKCIMSEGGYFEGDKIVFIDK